MSIVKCAVSGRPRHERRPSTSIPSRRRVGALVLAVVAALTAAGPLRAQSDVVRKVRAYRMAHEGEIIREFVGLLSIPNVAADLPNIRRNADRLVQMLEARGVKATTLDVGGPPYVYGRLDVPGATRTLLFYCHYDGQPADPSKWTGTEPWKPALRDGALSDGGKVIDFPTDGHYDPDWRIYARSSSDDKAPIEALMVVLDAMRDAGLAPKSNLKFLFEGEEEAGSPHLAEFIRSYGDSLSADLVLAADGPIDPSGRPTLFFGARGIVTAEITVYGPIRPLHSGHYGNWAPNPAMRLAQLLASMKDPETGRVLIPGFYSDVVPLTDFERQAIAEAPNDDEAQRVAFEFAKPEMAGRRFELLNLPSLNVRGLRSAWVGAESRTIVPDVAIASLDLRLVKDVQPQAQLDRLIRHIREQGFHVVSQEPDRATRLKYDRIAKVVSADGYPAFRTPMDLPISRALIDAVESGTGESAVKLPTLGGSVPLYVFTDILKTPTVGVPTVNHDNNQHSPNENIRLGHLWAAMETLAATMGVK